MRKTISGSRYDTETAQLLGTWDSSHDDGDLEAIKESLYRTKAGKYFLYGVGGAKSRYGKWVDNSNLEGGAEIIPFTREAAQKWAKEHLSSEEYEANFGLIIDKTKKEPLYLMISAVIKEKIRVVAEKQGVSMTTWVECVIENALDEIEKSRKI
jgi:predicted HicB family RNase H-like nuclease